MKIKLVLDLSKKIIITLTFFMATVRCADDQFLTETDQQVIANQLNTLTTTVSSDIPDCSSCDYVVPEGQTIVDGQSLGLGGGSVIGLNANISYTGLTFRNLQGTPDNPIVIKNCGGQVLIDGTGLGYGIKTYNSRYFRITGGEVANIYGIVVNSGHMGVNLGGLSTDFEVDHLEIKHSGFAGIIAKTDPSCDDATIRENFLMENVRLHHNYIHDTGGEGIYAGNSWYTGMNTACGVRLPHEIHNISIDHNILRDTGWEAIQLGCATKDASIHNNTVENYGTVNKKSQNNGIQIGSGTGGLCYNNLIRKGTGNGLIVMGLGDNIIYNNIIDQAGNFGVFCDERESPGPGFKFLNNTILNPGSDGIRIYAELVPMNVIVNNIIINPGSYSTYVYPRSPEDAFVYKLNNDVRIEMENNFFTTNIDSLQIMSVSRSGYDLETSSPVIDKGRDITNYHSILTDFLGNSRLRGTQYDIGAIEAFGENILPVADAGPNKILAVPASSTILQGSGTDSDGTIVSYKWTQYGGAPCTMNNAETPSLYLSGLVEGKYYFRLTVEDNNGGTHDDNVLVKVEPNEIPVADAGPNQIIRLPVNSVILAGTGTDSDGTIVSYSWSQYGGSPVYISNANSATASVSGLAAGKYYFRLTVTDDDGATHYDNMLVRVDESTNETQEADAQVNMAPEVNAGPNVIITLPETSTTIHGTASDSDGTIEKYQWTQYAGAEAVLHNAHLPSVTVSGLSEGKYYFKLTVVDNDGAISSDNVLVKVLPADS